MELKIESVTGCTADSLTINGIETAEMTKRELRDILVAILKSDYCPDTAYLQSWIDEIAQCHGKYETLYHCEQCGDTVTQSTLRVKIPLRTKIEKPHETTTLNP